MIDAQDHRIAFGADHVIGRGTADLRENVELRVVDELHDLAAAA
jgi:hypothetical protein